MNKRTTKKIQPEEKLNNEQKADKKQVSPAIANALVVGSQKSVVPVFYSGIGQNCPIVKELKIQVKKHHLQ